MTGKEVGRGPATACAMEESLQHMAASGFDIILGRREVPGGAGMYVALEHEGADEFPEFYATSFAEAVARARGWAEKETR